MGKFSTLVTAITLAIASFGAIVVGAAELDTPLRIIRTPAAEPPAAAPNEAIATRALLADRLGTVAATSPAAAPEGESATVALRLSQVDSAARRYASVQISAYHMIDEPSANALLRAIQTGPATAVAIGDEAWSDGAGVLAFRVGTYTVVLEGGSAAAREAAATALVERIGRQPVHATLARSLPAAGRVAGSERYAPSLEVLQRLRPDLTEDVLRLTAGGADAVVADYGQNGAAPLRLTIVEYQTPQLAGDAERSVQAYYAALAPEALASRLVKREGNYIVEATGVADRATAEAVVNSVRYEVTIKMLKGDDPVNMLVFTEEARKAALVFANSFMLVGIAFAIAIGLGLTVGLVIFLRRRRAAAELFTDAGGMTHLDIGPRVRRPVEPSGLLPGVQAD
jgi:hypothetical protein